MVRKGQCSWAFADPHPYHFVPLKWYGSGRSMWYDCSMLNRELEDAAAAIAFAQGVRRTHRRRSKPDAPQRKADIEIALKRLHEAMAPLRSHIHRFARQTMTEQAEENRTVIREASQAIQRERRKLHKMKQRSENDLCV